jgi:NAD(P)H-dependent FMN reductase
MLEGRRVVLLSGGRNESSRTQIALKVVAEALEEAGISTRLISVGDFELPMLDPDAAPPEAADEFRRVVREADGLIAGSPEYHSAPSGALKNLLDYLSSSEVAGKPVGLVASSGGDRGGINTLNMLRLIFRSLHAPVLVEQAAVSRSDFEGDQVSRPGARKRLHGVAEEMIRELSRS